MSYDQAFYAAQEPIALRSARAVLPKVLEVTFAEKVVDVGCGVAAWARVARDHGCQVHGVDENTPVRQLLIEPGEFTRANLLDGFDCTGYDLAICLEVGEHLPLESARALVQGLCRAPFVLFSGAHPGQGGVDHVNEQWPTWWAGLFAEAGYIGSSLVHWHQEAWLDSSVQDYYCENIAFYARRDCATELDLPVDLSAGVVDVIHPCRTGLWP